MRPRLAGRRLARIQLPARQPLTARGRRNGHLGDLIAAVVHRHQGAAADGLSRPLYKEYAAARPQDLAFRIAQHLAVLGFDREAALGQPGFVQGAPGVAMVRAIGDNDEGFPAHAEAPRQWSAKPATKALSRRRVSASIRRPSASKAS